MLTSRPTARYLSLVLGAVVLLLAAAACSGPPGPDFDDPAISVVTPPESDWQADELSARITHGSDGMRVHLDVISERPAASVLVELHFPTDYVARQAINSTQSGLINMLVSGQPGVLALGVIQPEGSLMLPGRLLSAELVLEETSAARSLSRVPSGEAGTVIDLAGTEDGLGSFTLEWGYYNSGDYDQNKQANIADLTPLAGRLQESAVDGDRDGLDSVLDGDGNGEVNVADITPLGANFLSTVDTYRIYRADGPLPDSANSVQVAEVDFASSTLETDSRRQFSAVLSGDALVTGEHYFVRAFDSASTDTGPASNTVLYEGLSTLKYRVPPSGSHTVDLAQSQNPSLLLLPAMEGLSQEGAPAIVYTTLGGGGGGATPLMLAYYGQAGWTTEEIGGGSNYLLPQAMWIPSDTPTGEAIVIAYEAEGLKVVDRRYDENWALLGSADVGAGSGVPTQISFDREASTGRLGVAQAYTEGATANLQYSYTDQQGFWLQNPVYSGENIGGLSFRFDPEGGPAWMLFTHGTIDTSETITIDFTLEQLREIEGNAWSMSEIPYPDSPLLVDLSFKPDGTPQLVCTAARDYTVNIPTLDPVTLSLLFDVAVGEYNGAGWTMLRTFESNFGISLGGGFPPSSLILQLDLATEAVWADPDSLIYSQNAGSIELSIEDFIPQDGALASDVQYKTRTAGPVFADSGYFDGQPGRSFSWQVNGDGEPVCAYVRSTTITAEDVLAGDFEAAGELNYWQP